MFIGNWSDKQLEEYIEDMQKGIKNIKEDLEVAVFSINKALEERDRRRAKEGGADPGYAYQED